MSVDPPLAFPEQPPLDLPLRLEIAAEAFVRYRTSCFWSLSPEFKVSEETLPLIISGLRQHGDRAAFQIAARLCR